MQRNNNIFPDHVSYIDGLSEGSAVQLKCPWQHSTGQDVVWILPDGRKVGAEMRDQR